MFYCFNVFKPKSLGKSSAEQRRSRFVQSFLSQKSNVLHTLASSWCTLRRLWSVLLAWALHLPPDDLAHLRAGDILVLVNGEYVVVEKVQHELLESPVKVYNFQVEDYHTYYVATIGVLVHNSCGSSHGNSLSTNKKTDLYALRDNVTGEVKKIGETTRGISRYTKSYYANNNVSMYIFDSGTKHAMHYQQHRILKKIVEVTGKLPGLNKSLW